MRHALARLIFYPLLHPSTSFEFDSCSCSVFLGVQRLEVGRTGEEDVLGEDDTHPKSPNRRRQRFCEKTGELIIIAARRDEVVEEMRTKRE